MSESPALVAMSREPAAPIARRRFLAAGLALLTTLPLSGIASAEGLLPTADQPESPPEGVVAAPYQTQFDGSPYASTNCGPTALSMFLGSFGEDYTTGELRESANQQMGNWDPNNGTTWESLVYAAGVRGYLQYGLYGSGKGYRAWTLDDLLQELSSGHPIMLLARYQYLPGHETSTARSGHYILTLGVDRQGNVVYHDSASHDQPHAYWTISQAQLNRAWSTLLSGINYSAMGLRRFQKVRGLLD